MVAPSPSLRTRRSPAQSPTHTSQTCAIHPHRLGSPPTAWLSSTAAPSPSRPQAAPPAPLLRSWVAQPIGSGAGRRVDLCAAQYSVGILQHTVGCSADSPQLHCGPSESSLRQHRFLIDSALSSDRPDVSPRLSSRFSITPQSNVKPMFRYTCSAALSDVVHSSNRRRQASPPRLQSHRGRQYVAEYCASRVLPSIPAHADRRPCRIALRCTVGGDRLAQCSAHRRKAAL